MQISAGPDPFENGPPRTGGNGFPGLEVDQEDIQSGIRSPFRRETFRIESFAKSLIG